ncbi:spermatogenesis-associated protein 33 [Hipposideros larvatus]
MGLSGSRHKPGEGEEQKTGCARSVPKPKGRSMDRHPQESERPPDAEPADGSSPQRGAAEQRRLSCEGQEKPDAKVKSSKKKVAVPQIVITRASDETLSSHSSIRSEEQRTIEERAEWGPYSRHRNPSTVDAYYLQTKA